MSKEAVKYVETLDVSYHVTKNVLLAIARRTFNDSGLCRCGQTSLMRETGLCDRSVRRHVSKLRQLGIITSRKRPGAGMGRLNDDLQIVGFKAWLNAQNGDTTTPSVEDTTGQEDKSPLAYTHQDSQSGGNRYQQSGIYIDNSNTSKTYIQEHDSNHVTNHVKHDSDHGTYHDREDVSFHDRVNVTNMIVTWGEEDSGGKPAPTTRVHPNDPVTEDDWQSLEATLTERFAYDDYFIEPNQKFFSKSRRGGSDA